MCDEKDNFQKSENPEEKPEESSPEKIEEGQGEAEENPCTEETEQKEQQGIKAQTKPATLLLLGLGAVMIRKKC